MKELEHVLGRIRVRLQDGTEGRLPQRLHAVLRVLAEATRSQAPELGCQISIDQLMLRSFKRRSTVLAALAEAQVYGILRRMVPETGSRYATSINYFDKTLTDAACKSRPYLGPAIFFEAKHINKKAFKKTNIKAIQAEKTQSIQRGSQLLGVRNLDLQYLDPEDSIKHPAPLQELLPPSVPALPLSSAPALPLSLVPGPAPHGGAGGGSDLNTLRIHKGGVCFLQEVLLEVEHFWTFLLANGVREVQTHFQRRNKNGKRGGTYLPGAQVNIQALIDVVAFAGLESVEVACTVSQVILVDDLDRAAVNRLAARQLAMMAIETSINNFQALLITGPDWTKEQVKNTQRALALEHGGDPAAITARQPHRLPGSLNLKENGCWVTRLTFVQSGYLLDPIDVPAPPAPIPSNNTSTPKPKKSQASTATGRDSSPSGQDFGRACQLLAAGFSLAAVQDEIATRARQRGKGGDAQVYARITVEAARKRLLLTGV